MIPSSRIVTLLPLAILWDEEGDIEAIRERWLLRAALQEMLRHSPVEFFVADVGRQLRRVEIAKCYDFWKSEVLAHLVDHPESPFRIEDFPDQYAYVASEWSGKIQAPIVLLEKHH